MDSKIWISVCNSVENLGPVGKFVANRLLRRISVNAPTLLGYCFVCTVVHLLSCTLVPGLSRFLSIEDDYFGLNSTNPLTYLRLITHVLAHSSLDHLKGNLLYLLLVGPSVEHEFGSRNLLFVILIVAMFSAIAHIAVGSSNTHQLGASGVVFSFILLNSLVSATSNTIPLSFLITAVIWVGDELWKIIFSDDNVSHHAHLTGAIVGSCIGMYLHDRRAKQLKNRSFASRLFGSKVKKR